MSEKNINISFVPEFVETALENVLEEPSKSIGDTFSDIWYLVLGGSVGQLAQKRKMKYAYELEKYKQKISEEIEKIPIQDRVDADIQIIGYILDASKYCVGKKELRDMFAKLIATSMKKNTHEYVKPIYIDIVSKMTVNDAKLFAKVVRMGDEDWDIEDDECYLSIESLVCFGLIKYIEDNAGLTMRENVNKVTENSITISIADKNVFEIKDATGRKKMYYVTALGMVLKKICF